MASTCQARISELGAADSQERKKKEKEMVRNAMTERSFGES